MVTVLSTGLPWSKCSRHACISVSLSFWELKNFTPTFSWRKAYKAIYTGYISIYSDLRGRPCTILFNWDIAPFWLLQLASFVWRNPATTSTSYEGLSTVRDQHRMFDLHSTANLNIFVLFPVFKYTGDCKSPFQVSSYIWMFPKIVGFPPKSSILIGFSIIFTIHFGVP